VNTLSPTPSFNPQLASGTPEPNLPFLIIITSPPAIDHLISSQNLERFTCNSSEEALRQ
jgi:hypothetical protein